MPYRLSRDGLKVLKENGQIVPGGAHKTHADALAHLRALEANVADAADTKAPAGELEDAPGAGETEQSEANKGEQEQADEAEAREPEQDQAPLPDVWVRAHPFGSSQMKDKDAHGEYFDGTTDFHDKLLSSVPVTYFHNHTPAGEWEDEPAAIGKTIARRYGTDGRWDKVRFNDDLPRELKARLAAALEQGRLRASPTVVPDFHEVAKDGHIRHWLTGSIAVLDAAGSRQPASSRAIALPVMKALYAQAHIQFPTVLEDKKRMKAQMKGTSRMERIKAMLMQLLQLADGQDEEEHAENETEDLKSTFDDTRPEDNVEADFPNDLTSKSPGPQTDATRFGAGARAVEKNDQPGAPKSYGSTEGDSEPDIHLDWSRREKAMKAQISALTSRADRADFDAWFESMLRAGRALPAERADMFAACTQLGADDRAGHPTMKAADGRPVSRVRLYQQAIEARQPTMNISGELLNTMKAAGFDKPLDDSQPMSAARRQELLNASALGQTVLKAKEH